MDAIQMIRAESAKQIVLHGPQLTTGQFFLGELVEAAISLLFTAEDDIAAANVSWPWDQSLMPLPLGAPGAKSRLEYLAAAGAYIVAEIERTRPPQSNGQFSDDFAYAAIAEVIAVFARATGNVGRIRDQVMRQAAIELLADYAAQLCDQMRAEIDQLTQKKGGI